MEAQLLNLVASSVSYTFLPGKVTNLPQRHHERSFDKNGFYQLVPLWLLYKIYIAKSIEWFYRGPGFLAVVWLDCKLSLVLSLPVCHRSSLLTGDRRRVGGLGAKSYECEKTWPSINHSILSAVLCLKSSFRAGMFKQSMGTRNRVRIGLLYRPARLHRLA
jgi:hypothetical protein